MLLLLVLSRLQLTPPLSEERRAVAMLPQLFLAVVLLPDKAVAALWKAEQDPSAEGGNGSILLLPAEYAAVV